MSAEELFGEEDEDIFGHREAEKDCGFTTNHIRFARDRPLDDETALH
jgi:hypothetical protein